MGKHQQSQDIWYSLSHSFLVSSSDCLFVCVFVCLFVIDQGSFSKEAAGQKWDRVKLVCTQPYNKVKGE